MAPPHRSPNIALWAFLIITPMALFGTAIFVLIVAASGSAQSAHGSSRATPAPPTEPPRPPPSKDDRSSGMTRMTALMKAANGSGCKRVVMAPEVMQGGHELTWTAVTGSCVRFFATTGVADNAIEVELRTPFGERLETPAASTEIDFTQCPKNKGPHKLHIVPATDDYFTIAGVECPLPKLAAKKRAATAPSGAAAAPSTASVKVAAKTAAPKASGSARP